jgi:hypothetical protein
MHKLVYFMNLFSFIDEKQNKYRIFVLLKVHSYTILQLYKPLSKAK